MADWITVVAYLIAAAASARAATTALFTREAGDARFWRLTAALMLFFAVNELLDLQTLLTAVGRASAHAYGWYEVRRTGQYYFILALAAFFFLGCVLALWFTRRVNVFVRVAMIGIGFIGLFVLLRAASFHHLDDLLGQGMKSFNFGSIQEMAGIIAVAIAAALYGRRKKIRGRPPSHGRTAADVRTGQNDDR